MERGPLAMMNQSSIKGKSSLHKERWGKAIALLAFTQLQILKFVLDYFLPGKDLHKISRPKTKGVLLSSEDLNIHQMGNKRTGESFFYYPSDES